MVEAPPTNAGLTHSQLQIWIGQKLSPESPLYNMAFAMVFPAELCTDRFQEAWRRVVDASDALRTSIVEHEGEPRLRIRDTGSGALEVLDFGAREDPHGAFRAWAHERSRIPFQLGGELVDSVLVRLGPGRTAWYLNQHHLIADAWSTILVYRRVAEEYAALANLAPLSTGDAGERGGSERGPAGLPPLPSYYRTAAALGSGPMERAAEPAGTPGSRSELPGRSVPLYGRGDGPSGTASVRSTLELDERRSSALERLCSEPGFASLSREMSRFVLWATLLTSWLRRISGESELSFDAPVGGRPTAEAKRAIGLFIEMFPFTATVSNEDTFRSLAAKCLAETQRLIRGALPGTSSPSSADSNVVLNFVPHAFGDFAGTPVQVEWVHPGHGDSVHALRLQVHDFSGTSRTTLHFDFNEAALPARLRQRGLEHFERMLDALLEDPDRVIDTVDVVTDEERCALAALNATGAAPLPERTVVGQFLARAEAEPERVALREGAHEVTFGELRDQVEALAATLVERGVGPGERVAILTRRSTLAVVATLATSRARAAYVPIDVGYPSARVEYILRDSGARVLLVGEQQQSTDQLSLPPGTAVLRIAEGVRAGSAAPRVREEPVLDDLAYLLYTSGSTGQPKGVLIEHRGLADYIGWAERRYVRGERMTFALFTSLSFDLTVTSLYLPLVTGGTLAIYPEPKGPVDSALIDVLGADAVDFIKLTPSHLTLLRQLGRANTRLRRMLVGGEDFKASLAAAVSAQLGDELEIHNEYGPTEAVVGCVAHRYDADADTGLSVPIGVPADHVEVEILNEALTPVPEGVPGELWVSRLGLARGYHGLEELTAERFEELPGRPGWRRYRTGDRVRLETPERLGYLGRLDRQLKISGFRIEPGEIEAALLSLPEVEECVVVAHSRHPARPRATGEVRRCLQCGLPSNYPGADLDEADVCNICRSYETIKEYAQGYFKTLDDLRALFAEAAQTRESEYDCMVLLSGGKDSTYALCKLVELGLSVYAFSLDNGFISEGAKENIRKVTGQLGVPVEFSTTPAMNAIFRDSLKRFSNVCHGCFKTIYTLSTTRARELGIPVIVTGLSRGQMFETRLTEEMFRDGRFSPEQVDAAVLAARKVYHRVDDEVSRSLDVHVFQDDSIFEDVRFVDFYRYCDVNLHELYATLEETVQWSRPADTGRSTNCLINDVGIHVHKQDRGYHNYALPYSWDVRMGHKTRAEALAELDDEIDMAHVNQVLAEIGFDEGRLTGGEDQTVLAAFYVGTAELSQAELRRRLGERIPVPLIPALLRRIDSMPLTVNGKLDEASLPWPEGSGLEELPYRAPEGPVEEYLAGVWRAELGMERIGTELSFFNLGGTSLAAMRVMIGLCREFDIDLPLETMFSYPTVQTLAYVAEERILADVATLDEDERRRLLSESDPRA